MGSTKVVSAPRSQASLSCSSPKSAMSLKVPPSAATNRLSTSWIAWFTSWWLAGPDSYRWSRNDSTSADSRISHALSSPLPMAPCDCPVPPRAPYP